MNIYNKAHELAKELKKLKEVKKFNEASKLIKTKLQQKNAR